MKTQEPMVLPLVVQQMLFMLTHYLPRIGAAEHVQGLTVDAQSDTEHTISIGNSGIGIDTGYGVRVKRLDGVAQVDGYRVFVMVVHPGSRNHPPEDEDVTTVETLSASDVLDEVGSLLARQAAENLPDFPEHMVGPQPVEEQAW